MKKVSTFNLCFMAFLGLALLLTLSACLLIWQTHLEQRTELLRTSRFQFSLNHTKSALESGLRLGLSGADLPGAQKLIEQVRARETDILSIDVFDRQGQIMFTTDQDGVGNTIPADWRQACLNAAPNIWSGKDADAHLQCTVLINSYEQISGGILLRHRLPPHISASGPLPNYWPLLVALGLFLTIGYAVDHIAARGVKEEMDQLANAIVQGKAQSHALLPSMFGGFAALSDIEKELEETNQELNRLDHIETHA